MAKMTAAEFRRKASKSTHRYTNLSKGRIAKRGVRNKTEARYETTVLFPDPEIADYWFEPFSIQLSHPETGRAASYTPDFMVLYKDGRTEFVDVKGSGKDDTAAIVRIKTAAELFPLWRWKLAKERGVGKGFVDTYV
jgi:hypothetical protein